MGAGNLDRARALFEESLQIEREFGHAWGEALVVGNLGALALVEGDPQRAVRLAAAAAAQRDALGEPLTPSEQATVDCYLRRRARRWTRPPSRRRGPRGEPHFDEALDGSVWW
jgi:hypothetical protein